MIRRAPASTSNRSISSDSSMFRLPSSTPGSTWEWQSRGRSAMGSQPTALLRPAALRRSLRNQANIGRNIQPAAFSSSPTFLGDSRLPEARPLGRRSHVDRVRLSHAVKTPVLEPTPRISRRSAVARVGGPKLEHRRVPTNMSVSHGWMCARCEGQLMT